MPRAVIAFVVLTLVTLPGCSGKTTASAITRADADKVQVGMTVADFKKVFERHNISKNESTNVVNAKSQGTMTYSDGTRSVTIDFVDGKVVKESEQGFE